MSTLRITPYVDLQPQDVLPRPPCKRRNRKTPTATPTELHKGQVWTDEDGRSHTTGEGRYWFRTTTGRYFTGQHADAFDALMHARKTGVIYEGPAMMRNR